MFVYLHTTFFLSNKIFFEKMKFLLLLLLFFHTMSQSESQLFNIENQPWFRSLLASLPFSKYDQEFFPTENDKLSRPVVTIKDGLLRGFILRTVDKNRKIASFQGIPYAQPPLGNLRFRDPVKNLPWRGIRNARHRSPVCTQLDLSQPLEGIHGQEDCLYLNVYVPSQNAFKSAPLPVMVLLHGGFFFLGAARGYGPRYLLDHNVILVVVNYRLGPFGFFSTGDYASPGNQGLKDQVLALKWVRENIGDFGGDPNSVTIFGQSAGAVSVGLHLVSPLSRGLFHRAILQSGSGFCFWASSPNAVEIAKRVGKLKNCPTNSSEAMIDCLRKVPAKALAAVQILLADWYIFPLLRFTPTVEPAYSGAFMTKSLREYYEDGEVARVNAIFGITSHELSFLVSVFIKFPLAVNDVNTELERVGPSILNANTTEINAAKINKIWNFYMGDDSKLTWATRLNASQMLSDRYITLCALEGLQYHSLYTNKSVYGYYLSYQGRYSAVQLTGSRPQDWGVVHGDDSMYLFNSPEFFPSLSSEDPEFKMSQVMTSMWTNFATYDKPFLTIGNIAQDIWQPVSIKENILGTASLLNFNIAPHMINYTYIDRLRFWKNEVYTDDSIEWLDNSLFK